jgi:hypothetical protein
VLLGVFLIADRNDPELLAKVNDSDVAEGHQITPNLLLAMGIIAFILAAVIIVCAVALSRGSKVARWVFALVLVSIVANGIYGLVALHGEQQYVSAFSMVFAVFTLWYLFSSDSAVAYFEDVQRA